MPVDIPFINSGEGWILSGHADSIEVVSKDQVEFFPMEDNVAPACEHPNEVTISIPDNVIDSTKFNSDVSGTAKLVRSKGCIKIVARRGKTIYNQTTPNSVCISENMKNEFFKDCRMWHGASSGIFLFTEKQDYVKYREWSLFIDEEYKRQKLRALGAAR